MGAERAWCRRVVVVVRLECTSMERLAAHVGVDHGAGVRIALGVMDDQHPARHVIQAQVSLGRFQFPSQVAGGRVRHHAVFSAAVAAEGGVAHVQPGIVLASVVEVTRLYRRGVGTHR